ncbi:uncharacterized protein HMPREF1120_03926 [Exophiala dermatitidis NIH/UT8656]|uniref:Uncharacterized protein n=1 Tax=Exophiala dermatitidis (strain ATCC 34100 / CBS 525.76 / NIH/UT8656) TaxID=858893 RepID=H6BV21_EXODN|nr:uncharacterized protein HMPREF1120_03926 [Exophiala dermatitidis NIH/UT8656]EHY55804.1 hypothetical protein HMPREF1120_03926 [Exophiala dermatitidis NIH/UT8656]
MLIRTHLGQGYAKLRALDTVSTGKLEARYHPGGVFNMPKSLLFKLYNNYLVRQCCSIVV